MVSVGPLRLGACVANWPVWSFSRRVFVPNCGVYLPVCFAGVVNWDVWIFDRHPCVATGMSGPARGGLFLALDGENVPKCRAKRLPRPAAVAFWSPESASVEGGRVGCDAPPASARLREWISTSSRVATWCGRGGRTWPAGSNRFRPSWFRSARIGCAGSASRSRRRRSLAGAAPLRASGGDRFRFGPLPLQRPAASPGQLRECRRMRRPVAAERSDPPRFRRSPSGRELPSGAGNPPRLLPSSRSGIQEAGAPRSPPRRKGSVRTRRELPGAKRKFPAASGSSQSKKMESGRSGNYLIQKDGIFSRRELPGRVGNFPIQKDGIFLLRQTCRRSVRVTFAAISRRRVAAPGPSFPRRGISDRQVRRDREPRRSPAPAP
jgi:hypothetical protein